MPRDVVESGNVNKGIESRLSIFVGLVGKVNISTLEHNISMMVLVEHDKDGI